MRAVVMATGTRFYARIIHQIRFLIGAEHTMAEQQRSVSTVRMSIRVTVEWTYSGVILTVLEL